MCNLLGACNEGDQVAARSRAAMVSSPSSYGANAPEVDHNAHAPEFYHLPPEVDQSANAPQFYSHQEGLQV